MEYVSVPSVSTFDKYSCLSSSRLVEVDFLSQTKTQDASMAKISTPVKSKKIEVKQCQINKPHTLASTGIELKYSRKKRPTMQGWSLSHCSFSIGVRHNSQESNKTMDSSPSKKRCPSPMTETHRGFQLSRILLTNELTISKVDPPIYRITTSFRFLHPLRISVQILTLVETLHHVSAFDCSAAGHIRLRLLR